MDEATSVKRIGCVTELEQPQILRLRRSRNRDLLGSGWQPGRTTDFCGGPNL